MCEEVGTIVKVEREEDRVMATLALKVQDKMGKTICVNNGEDYVSMVCCAEYQEGDQIVLEISESNIFVMLQLDDAMGEELCYVTGNVYYQIPFGEKRISYSPKAFYGNRHYLYARIATKEEISSYRNLACNVYDQHENKSCYPHAWANVETRGESVFAARNAIDKVCENRSHGEWPYESWGINMRDDAEITVEFGREVEVDKIVLFTRADFPHDNWWKQVSISFSDGTKEVIALEKSALPHTIPLTKRITTKVCLSELIKSEEPSPFPALSQILVYGREVGMEEQK